jgi:hypothetical protein
MASYTRPNTGKLKCESGQVPMQVNAGSATEVLPDGALRIQKKVSLRKKGVPNRAQVDVQVVC